MNFHPKGNVDKNSLNQKQPNTMFPIIKTHKAIKYFHELKIKIDNKKEHSRGSNRTEH